MLITKYMRYIWTLHLPSEGIHSKPQALPSSETITNKYFICSISVYLRYPNSYPPTSTSLYSTSKVECPTQPIIGQCTHIYPTDRNNEWLERVWREGGNDEGRE